MKNRLNDVIDPKIKFELVEASDVDGEHILAKVRGIFFCPDGESRNGRFYPKELWETVLSNHAVIERLSSKNMFGTVGHETKLNDKAVLEGHISHIVTSLEINENDEGIGEALILNTPAGRTLNTILRAGGKMYVSTRANGTLSKHKHEGLPVVDKDTYDFQTVDFVCDAGFLQASPKLQEAFNNLDNDNTSKEGNIMDNEKLVKLITDENASLKVNVGNLTDEVSALTEDKTSLVDENKHLKKELEKLEEANKIIETYKALGTVEEIEASKKELEEAKPILVKVSELGESIEDVESALQIGHDFMKEVNTEIGSIEETKTALETAIKFKKVVDGLGTVEEIKESIEKLDKIGEENEKAKKEKEAKELAEELKLDVTKVASLLEKYSVEDVKELYGEVANDSRYKKQNEDNDDDNNDDDDENNDDKELEIYESKILGKSYAERING